MRKIAVLLLSGGLDSTTVAAYAMKQGYELRAITLDYGQKHRKEIDCARRVSGILGMKQEVVDISFFRKLAWYSALTNPEELEVPLDRARGHIADDIPVSYVPMRNTMFLSLAAAYLESEVLDLIERRRVSPDLVEASLFIAANAVDYSGYPDCRPEYYEQMSRALAMGSKLGTQYARPIHIRTPIILKSKADIVRMAMDLGAPLEHTWSCYEGGEYPCGRCDSCILRAAGFSEAGLEDPLLARLSRESRK